jgi:hypothetical protein
MPQGCSCAVGTRCCLTAQFGRCSARGGNAKLRRYQPCSGPASTCMWAVSRARAQTVHRDCSLGSSAFSTATVVSRGTGKGTLQFGCTTELERSIHSSITPNVRSANREQQSLRMWGARTESRITPNVRSANREQHHFECEEHEQRAASLRMWGARTESSITPNVRSANREQHHSECEEREQCGRSFKWQIINGVNGKVINAQILRSLWHEPHLSMKGLINIHKECRTGA